MIVKHPVFHLAVCLISMIPLRSTAHILESFTVTTQDVEVREFNESSIQFKANKNTYNIKLEPNKAGNVIFSLTGIGYRSTVKFSNLLFGVKITGYRNDEVVYPTFSFDDVNRDMTVDRNVIIFQRIYGAMPIWFNEQVDSVQLQFSNSYAADIDQYLSIQDLKIVPRMDVFANPHALPCQENHVMIAIDGSSSIDKDERTMIGSQLLDFVRKSSFAQDTHQLCIVEFGSDILSVVESREKKELVRAIQDYKRGRNDKSKFTKWTNWSVAFDEALARKPEIFIFITDGWSNWSSQHPSSFSAQYEHLISQCNQLKANGTRMLFVTSDIDSQRNSRTILSSLLNDDRTIEVRDGMLNMQTSLADVDLITLKTFETMREVNFATLLECPEVITEAEHPKSAIQTDRKWQW